MDPNVFKYFHQFTREPWHIDKIVLPKEPVKKPTKPYIRSFESLIRDAEALGLSHDQAIKVAYDKDNENARQDFKIYHIFMKYGIDGFIRYTIDGDKGVLE